MDGLMALKDVADGFGSFEPFAAFAKKVGHLLMKNVSKDRARTARLAGEITRKMAKNDDVAVLDPSSWAEVMRSAFGPENQREADPVAVVMLQYWKRRPLDSSAALFTANAHTILMKRLVRGSSIRALSPRATAEADAFASSALATAREILSCQPAGTRAGERPTAKVGRRRHR
jgi:hypothetical protein